MNYVENIVIRIDGEVDDIPPNSVFSNADVGTEYKFEGILKLDRKINVITTESGQNTQREDFLFSIDRIDTFEVDD